MEMMTPKSLRHSFCIGVYPDISCTKHLIKMYVDQLPLFLLLLELRANSDVCKMQVLARNARNFTHNVMGVFGTFQDVPAIFQSKHTNFKPFSCCTRRGQSIAHKIPSFNSMFVFVRYPPEKLIIEPLKIPACRGKASTNRQFGASMLSFGVLGKLIIKVPASTDTC